MNIADKIKDTEITMTMGELQESAFNAVKEGVETFLKRLQTSLREHPETSCTFGQFADMIDQTLQETADMTIDNWTDYL